GLVKPDTLRTNCRAAASMSSVGATWVPSRRRTIDLHILSPRSARQFRRVDPIRIIGWARPNPISDAAPRGLASHAAAVPAPDVVEAPGDLSQAGDLRDLHQGGERVLACGSSGGEALEGGRQLPSVAVLERFQAADLSLLGLVGGPDQAIGFLERRAFLRQEGVHPDDRVLAALLHALVVERLLLDASPLVLAFHGAQHPTARVDPVELRQHRLFHQVRQLLDDERALEWVLVLGQAELPVDDELDGEGS